MIESTTSVRCEIVASDSKLRNELKQIAQTCARDLKLALPLFTFERKAAESRTDAKINIHIPAQTALANSAVWSLACHVACFCPQVNIATFIENP